VKTDNIDVGRLLRSLMAYLRGEPKVWSVVRVPSVTEEDDRRLHRERDRLIRAADTINPFDAPPGWQSALHEYRQRTPPPPPGTVIAIHDSTDGPAILKRVLGEDDRRRTVERERKRRWRAARSPGQIASCQARDRKAARRRRRSAPSAG
jgi:hypothetical protein